MKKKELVIVVAFLIVPLILCYILQLSFLTTIIVSLLLGAVGLTLAKQSDLAKKLIATATTIGVFIGIGYTVSWFFNLFYIFAMMYIYSTTENIEEALVKIIGSVLFLYLVKLWFDSTKEGMIVSGLVKISDDMTALQCQDNCASFSDCRYSVVPKGSSLSGERRWCKIGRGLSQNIIYNYPGENHDDVWFNKNYKAPVVLRRTYNDFLSSTGSRAKNIRWGYHYLRQPIRVKKIRISFNGRDQGWGNPTYGVYVKGYRNGSQVFSKVVKIPRTGFGIIVPVSSEWSLNTNPVDRIDGTVYSRGQGHSFLVHKLNYEIAGTPE